MRKIFYLSSCDTCQKIVAQLNKGVGFELQDIKQDPISAGQLDALKDKTGSYEALFSRRALKFRSMGLHLKPLSEADYRELILQEYTFLKRPVIIIDDEVFVGNAPSVVEAAKAKL